MLWLLIVNHVKSLLETSDVTLKQERQNALEALLDTLSVATEVEIFSAEQSLVSPFFSSRLEMQSHELWGVSLNELKTSLNLVVYIAIVYLANPWLLLIWLTHNYCLFG